MRTVDSAKWQDSDQTTIKATIDGIEYSGIMEGNRFWDIIMNSGVLIDPPDPEPVPEKKPLTAEELYSIGVTKGLWDTADRPLEKRSL